MSVSVLGSKLLAENEGVLELGVELPPFGVNRMEDEIFERADIFGVMSFRAECIGEGVYDARKALSVPSLMPNLEVANLCAAGDMVDTLVDKLATDLGVLMLERAC